MNNEKEVVATEQVEQQQTPQVNIDTNAIVDKIVADVKEEINDVIAPAIVDKINSLKDEENEKENNEKENDDVSLGDLK